MSQIITRDTLNHKANVQNYMKRVNRDITIRGRDHDNSKLMKPEKEMFDSYLGRLSTLTYGSEEYKEILEEMKRDAVGHHYKHNDHHPEHFENGIQDMNLIQLIEMICDWMAACDRRAADDIVKSIEINQGRFGYSDEVKSLLLNTAQYIKELR